MRSARGVRPTGWRLPEVRPRSASRLSGLLSPSYPEHPEEEGPPKPLLLAVRIQSGIRTHLAPLDRAMRDAGLADLAPGYFALVIATGILSVAAADEGLPGVSVVWLWVAVVGYAVLVALNAARIARFKSSVAMDLANPSTSFEFFSFVAATCVLGTRLAVGRTVVPALGLWLVGLVGWVLTCSVIPLMARARVDLR